MAIGRGMAIFAYSREKMNGLLVSYYWRRGWDFPDYVKVEEISRMEVERWKLETAPHCT
jgi:hypothetical protein